MTITLIEQVNAATECLDQLCIAHDQEWASRKLDRQDREDFIEGSKEAGKFIGAFNRFDRTACLIAWYGSKGAYNLMHGRSREDALAKVKQSTERKIENRNHRIADKLSDAGVEALPAGEKMQQTSDGYEGVFMIAGKIITIQTILAGGYNVQCLHNRTLVNIE